jgi:hypothetical protein
MKKREKMIKTRACCIYSSISPRIKIRRRTAQGDSGYDQIQACSLSAAYGRRVSALQVAFALPFRTGWMRFGSPEAMRFREVVS